MSTPFLPVTETFFVAPQISEEDIVRAAEDGFTLIINNRPDGEALDQPATATLRAAAQARGLTYVDVPVSDTGLTDAQLSRMAELLSTGHKALAFCRSGTRSITLRSYAMARMGADTDQLLREAAAAGYDLSAHRPRLSALQDRG